MGLQLCAFFIGQRQNLCHEMYEAKSVIGARLAFERDMAEDRADECILQLFAWHFLLKPEQLRWRNHVVGRTVQQKDGHLQRLQLPVGRRADISA